MNKYRNRKVEVDGIVFDSKKEAKRYQELLMLEKAGVIQNIRRQQKFVLIPAQYSTEDFTKTGKAKCIERECTYLADFVYEDSKGRTCVEDVKGYKRSMGYSYFAIKRKLMLYVHGIRVKEI